MNFHCTSWKVTPPSRIYTNHSWVFRDQLVMNNNRTYIYIYIYIYSPVSGLDAQWLNDGKQRQEVKLRNSHNNTGYSYPDFSSQPPPWNVNSYSGRFIGGNQRNDFSRWDMYNVSPVRVCVCACARPYAWCVHLCVCQFRPLISASNYQRETIRSLGLVTSSSNIPHLGPSVTSITVVFFT